MSRINLPAISFGAYSIAVVLLVGLKYFLVSAQHMSAFTQFVIDDGLFVHQANHIINGLWLGDFNNLTLAKGCIYPVFIAAVNAIGLPLLTAQFFLYAFAAHFVIRALTPILKNPYLQILLFAIILFNPMASHAFTTRVLRDSFYTSVSVMMIAGFLGMFLRRHCKARTLFYWAVFTGLLFFVQQNTREEGLTFFPVILLISLFTLLSGVIPGKRVQPLGHTKTGEWGRRAAFVFLPYAMLVLGNISIAAVNYYHYGCFIRNDIREGSFPQAYAALTKIKTDTLVNQIPVSREARIKAYAVSPAFAELMEYLDGNKRPESLNQGKDNSDIIGGFLMWELKRAVSESGHGGSLMETQRFYQRIADEINLAFDRGKLQKKNNLSFAGFSLDLRQFRPVCNVYVRAVIPVAGFEGYSAYPVFYKADIEGIKQFQYITNESALLAPVSPDEYQIPSKAKFRILYFIARLYHWINPVMTVLAILSFLIITVYLINNRNRQIIFDYWLISLTFFCLVVIRIALISYMEAMQWPGALIPQYLSVVYPFMLIFEFVSLYIIFIFVKSKVQRNVLVSKGT